MSVLIVGGDYVESLKRQIAAQGYKHIEHWHGRKKGFIKRKLASDTRLIVMVCDYVNHSLANSLKDKANRKGIPLIYCRHAMHELKQKLLDKDEENACCPC